MTKRSGRAPVQPEKARARPKQVTVERKIATPLAHVTAPRTSQATPARRRATALLAGLVTLLGGGLFSACSAESGQATPATSAVVQSSAAVPPSCDDVIQMEFHYSVGSNYDYSSHVELSLLSEGESAVQLMVQVAPTRYWQDQAAATSAQARALCEFGLKAAGRPVAAGKGQPVAKVVATSALGTTTWTVEPAEFEQRLSALLPDHLWDSVDAKYKEWSAQQT